MGTSRSCTRTTSTAGGGDGGGVLDCLQANTSTIEKRPTRPKEGALTMATTRITSSHSRTRRGPSGQWSSARVCWVSPGNRLLLDGAPDGRGRRSRVQHVGPSPRNDATRSGALAKRRMDQVPIRDRWSVTIFTGRYDRHSIPARAQARRGQPISDRTRTYVEIARAVGRLDLLARRDAGALACTG